MRERKEDKLDLPVYEAHPPAWLPQAHGSADLGYIGFYPPQPGQDEDILSAKNMREGFILGEQVSAENFSAQAMINENLHSNDTLSKLEELMNEVFSRRAERIPAIPPSSFRMQSRATFNENKRDSWFADLANPDVPLHKLGKYIPHGAKGHDLLDLLHSKNVALPRAVWFLRVVGANETAGLRNKPHYDPGQYSIDWANLVTSYMKKQLVDIALPIAARPGLNIKQTFKGVLSDPETRERWISRFTYCLKLLRSFYREGLVDHRTFLVWVVQQMGTCNLAQAGFVTRLADEYLDGMFGSRALAHPFVDACLGKLSEIHATSAQEYLVSTDGLIKSLLQRLCLAIPDAFVSPRMWAVHSNLLTNVLSENIMDHANDQHVGQNGRDIQQMLLCHLADIRRRNEAMLFRNLPIRVSARLGSAVSHVKLLNSIGSSTNMDSVIFFASDGDDTAFAEKLDMLLTWSVTPLQYGDHRPFAAVTLIRKWRERAGDRATRRDFTPPDEFLQDHLFEWLDSSEVSGNPDNIRAVALLFGKLVKHDLFSYAKYIQRLIARGEPGLSYTEEGASRHRNFLRWIPLFQSDPTMVNQRKVTLYGVRARETEEDINGRQIRKEIRTVLPDVFGGSTESRLISTTALLTNCGALASAVRYEQVRIFQIWLLPILQKHIPSQISDASQRRLLNIYYVSVELMTHAKCFHSILDLTLCTLEHCVTLALLNAVVDTLRRFAVIWTCINVKGDIIKALNTAYQLWKTRGIQSRTLLDLLIEFDQGHYLDSASRERVRTDIASITLALQPIASRPESVPDVLPEILVLAGDPDPDAPSILANGLWIKYRMSYDWAWKVWDNTVASLRQVPTMTPDIASRRACSLRYGAFLWHVDQHLPEGLDGQVMRWFLGPGKNEVVALNSETWDVFSALLLYLAVHGALKTTTILRALIHPTWQQAACLSGPQLANMVNLLGAANFLCHRLLLCEDGSGEDMPPTDIFDVQCLRTRRQAVYDDHDFPMLVASIPLLIILEHNEQLPGNLRQESAMLCRRLCQDRDFRLGAYRNLSIIRDAFEGSLQTAENAEQFGQHVIAGLYSILCDSDDIQISNWPAITSMLSPWKIPATTMKLQFVLRQMGHALTQESTQHAASADLDKLILMIFHHSMTSDEAYYVAEMARGVDITVASKFVNHGLKCIAEVLQESATYNAEDFRRAGELLRVLIYLLEPLREDLASLPVLDPLIQDEFFDTLCAKFTETEALSTNLEGSEIDYCQITQGIMFLARLLQFDLGLQGSWTPKTREASGGILSSIFKLTLLHGTGEGLDLIAYPLLIDTLYYLYDEIPADSKSVTFDPFRNYPAIPASEIPNELPLEYRKQLMSLLPHLLSITVVTNLVTSHRDAAGNIVYGPPVINRPWEWTEYLGEPSDMNEESRDQEENEQARTKYPIKNSGSLSLETFGARLTGDGILRNLGPNNDPRNEGNLLTFEDGLSADGMFKRDWRETRLHIESEPTHENSARVAESDAGGPYYPGLARGDRRTPPKASPASSVVSRSSARGSANSMRMSPNQSALNRLSGSTASEIVEIESIATVSSSKRGSGSKRKSAPAVSDDEIEIIEGPLPIPTKKPRGKAPAKAKARKK